MVQERAVHPASPLRRAALVLAIIGLLDALYLVSIKIFPSAPMCFGVGDCETVNNSIYSTIHGIPIALFGALAYAAILGAILLEPRMAFFAAWGPTIEFGLAFAGMLYSAYLTYIELGVLHKICPYCVISAIAITSICIVSGVRMQRQSE
jgi:uncharacterized membrane protein